MRSVANYQWQINTNAYDLNNPYSYTDISGATSKDYNPGTIIATRGYRRMVNGTCTSSSNIVKLFVTPDISNTIIASGSTSNCGPINEYNMGGSASGGENNNITYQWQSSTDGITFSNILNQTSQQYNAGQINIPTYYRRIAYSGYCTNYSNVLFYNTNSAPANPKTITGNTYICKPATEVPYSIVSVNGATSYSWLYSGEGVTINGNGINVILNFAANATSGTLSVVAKNSCGTSDASSLSVTINPLPAVFNVTGGGSYCAGGSGVEVGLSGSETGVSYQLYRDGMAIGSTVSGTSSAISFGSQTAGTYTIKATNSSTFCTLDMNGTISVTDDDQIAPVITQCLPNGTVSCVSKIPAGKTSYQDFHDAGGEVTENCTALNNLKVTFVDVISHDGECKVTRTYTIADVSGNIGTCTQVFTITDGKAPEIKTVDKIVVAPDDNNCSANLTINQPTDIDENCSLVNEGAYYEYKIAEETKKGNGVISDIFPEGTTLITWTVTDVCGHVSAPIIQTVHVGFNLTSISYDNGSTETGNGSGIQPMQTSTHEYFVDDKTSEEGYSYDWNLYENNGTTTVTSCTITEVNNNPTHIKITFTGIQAGNYILSVIKTKNGMTCKNQSTRSVKVLENTFDTELKPFYDHCQAGETGTPSTILWEVTFTEGGVAPYSLNYKVYLTDESNNQTIPCSGSVSNITLTGKTSSLSLSGCSDAQIMPYMQVEKTVTDSYKVLLKYTMSSITARNFKASIQIYATDQFSVSEIEPGNNSETLDLHGVPNTSPIATD